MSWGGACFVEYNFWPRFVCVRSWRHVVILSEQELRNTHVLAFKTYCVYFRRFAVSTRQTLIFSEGGVSCVWEHCGQGLSSPFWPYLFHSIVQRLHLVVLKEFQHFCPCSRVCVTPPYCPMLSFGLHVFPSLESKYVPLILLLLAFYTIKLYLC